MTLIEKLSMSRAKKVRLRAEREQLEQKYLDLLNQDVPRGMRLGRLEPRETKSVELLRFLVSEAQYLHTFRNGLANGGKKMSNDEIRTRAYSSWNPLESAEEIDFRREAQIHPSYRARGASYLNNIVTMVPRDEAQREAPLLNMDRVIARREELKAKILERQDEAMELLGYTSEDGIVPLAILPSELAMRGGLQHTEDADVGDEESVASEDTVTARSPRAFPTFRPSRKSLVAGTLAAIAACGLYAQITNPTTLLPFDIPGFSSTYSSDDFDEYVLERAQGKTLKVEQHARFTGESVVYSGDPNQVFDKNGVLNPLFALDVPYEETTAAPAQVSSTAQQGVLERLVYIGNDAYGDFSGAWSLADEHPLTFHFSPTNGDDYLKFATHNYLADSVEGSYVDFDVLSDPSMDEMFLERRLSDKSELWFDPGMMQSHTTQDLSVRVSLYVPTEHGVDRLVQQYEIPLQFENRPQLDEQVTVQEPLPVAAPPLVKVQEPLPVYNN